VSPPEIPPLPPGVLDDLRRRHAAPGRHYHTWSHVEALLAHLDAERDATEDPAALALAIVFHDAVYDPRAADNEVRSAELALAALAGHVEPDRIARVRRLVLATQAHRVPETAPPGEAGDTARLLDWDLAILGAGPEGFAAYEAGIRAEYAHVPMPAYRAGRTAVLQSFLDRAPLYLTESARARYEALARGNLQRAILALA